MDLAAREVLTEEVASLLEKKAIEEVKTRDSGFYSNLFVMPKKTGGLRPVGEVVHNAISIYNPPWNDSQFTGNVPQSPFYQDPGSPPRSHEIIEHLENDIEMSIELHRESSGDVNFPSSGTSAQEVIRIEEPIAVESEVLDIDSNTYRSSDPEPALLEEPAEVMEWPVVSARDSRDGSLYRCQRHSMGDSCGLTYLFRLVDTYPGIDAYKRQGAIDSIICTPAPECCWSVGINIFRQYHHAGIREEVWRYYLPQIARDFRGNMGALPEDEYSTSGNLRTVSDEPGRCSEPVNSADRMFSIHPSVCNDKLALVSGSQGCRPKLPSVQLGNIEQSLRLPSMESNPTNDPEGAPGASNNYAGNSAMEDSDLVPRSAESIGQSAIITTSDNSNTRPKKQKITEVEEQALVPDSMENQRRILQAQGLADTAIDLIVSNQ
ncbi:hypothetical protein AYI68_g8254 [Smittium mucronatum]|uniref:Uncharacterized protein n=1 Tax=Smittium mucronatum TaxID=133383 RepID=A0A1R0GLE6_9FUNG|nr:hypothetical protein AYI68_g8254 [Smittium mucronatum]